MATDLEEEYDKIYRYCYMKLGHRQLAEDVTQETFLRCLENHTYREIGRRISYLYAIARNLCVDQYRRRKDIPCQEEAAEGHEEQVVEYLALWQVIKQLTEEEQELIFLRYVNDLPVYEISRILGMSRFAVHRRTKKILGKMRELLEGKENAG